jgi:hypothetical protein
MKFAEAHLFKEPEKVHRIISGAMDMEVVADYTEGRSRREFSLEDINNLAGMQKQFNFDLKIDDLALDANMYAELMAGDIHALRENYPRIFKNTYHSNLGFRSAEQDDGSIDFDDSAAIVAAFKKAIQGLEEQTEIMAKLNRIQALFMLIYHVLALNEKPNGLRVGFDKDILHRELNANLTRHDINALRRARVRFNNDNYWSESYDLAQDILGQGWFNPAQKDAHLFQDPDKVYQIVRDAINREKLAEVAEMTIPDNFTLKEINELLHNIGNNPGGPTLFSALFEINELALDANMYADLDAADIKAVRDRYPLIFKNTFHSNQTGTEENFKPADSAAICRALNAAGQGFTAFAGARENFARITDPLMIIYHVLYLGGKPNDGNYVLRFDSAQLGRQLSIGLCADDIKMLQTADVSFNNEYWGWSRTLQSVLGSNWFNANHIRDKERGETRPEAYLFQDPDKVYQILQDAIDVTLLNEDCYANYISRYYCDHCNYDHRLSYPECKKCDIDPKEFDLVEKFSLSVVDGFLPDSAYGYVSSNIRVDFIALDSMLAELNAKDIETLRGEYGGILKDSFFNDERNFNKHVKFKKPADVCSAFMGAVMADKLDVRMVRNLGRMKNPAMLIYHLIHDSAFLGAPVDSTPFDIQKLVFNITRLHEKDIENLLSKEFYFNYPSVDSGACDLGSLWILGDESEDNSEKLKEKIKMTKKIESKMQGKNLSKECLEAFQEVLREMVPDTLDKFISLVIEKTRITENYITGKEEEFKSIKDKHEEVLKTFETARQGLMQDLREKAQEMDQKLQSSANAINSVGQDIEAKLVELQKKRPVEITINLDGKKKKIADDDFRHEKYQDTMRVVAGGLSPYLVGPAGSGKSTILEQVARDLELPYYPMPVNSQTSEYNIIGYNNASGEYVRTAFRDAYEHGGVFLFEEIDAGNPNVMTVINNSISQTSYLFPDGKTIKKHQKFIAGASANTYGRGASLQYIGRNPLDAATIDRFAMISVDYDHKLEQALCLDKDWCEYVWEIRRAAGEFNIKMVVSTRAVIFGPRLLAQGFQPDDVSEMLIWKGTTKEDVDKVKSRINTRIKNRMLKIDVQNERGGPSLNLIAEVIEPDDVPF